MELTLNFEVLETSDLNCTPSNIGLFGITGSATLEFNKVKAAEILVSGANNTSGSDLVGNLWFFNSNRKNCIVWAQVIEGTKTRRPKQKTMNDFFMMPDLKTLSITSSKMS
ncbi:hypothetical protein [Pedobacter sp. JCM 36344]|uniref:hypothetical protein n=1 Tax=Pedobacter sp. JCM 36344 TaxID=3374280 RepID=UPI0039798E50